MKFTAKLVWSLVLLGVGVLFYVLAVSGALFDFATDATDVGLYAVTVTLFAFGGFGLYVALREQKEQADTEEA